MYNNDFYKYPGLIKYPVKPQTSKKKYGLGPTISHQEQT